MERGSVQCDGRHQLPADAPLWSQHHQLTVGTDPGPELLPQQGLSAFRVPVQLLTQNTMSDHKNSPY